MNNKDTDFHEMMSPLLDFLVGKMEEEQEDTTIELDDSVVQEKNNEVS